MSANISSHATSSSRDKVTGPELFQSTPPSFGGDDQRQPVDTRGFEALEGVQLPAALPAPPQQRIRAISELTFAEPEPAPGAALPESLLAVARTPVPNTALYPWRANAALLITVPGESDLFLATGWFIGPYAVITAGHAVYPRQLGGHTGWVSQVEVIPGLNGFGAARPFGSAFSDTFEAPTAWQESGDRTQDYAVVLLNQGLGLTVGAFGYATYSTNDILSAGANLSGYPVASPDGTEPQGRQWYGAGGVTSVDSSFVFYQLGTLIGDSGSCLYRNIGGNPFAMAIHTSTVGGNNRGVRITAPVYANLQRWASMRA